MDVIETQPPLAERKLMRRGLLAGLAALSAATVFKITGTSKAEAGADGDVILGGTSTAGDLTTLISASVTNKPGFQVNAGGSVSVGKSGIVGVTNADAGAGVRGINGSAAGYGVFGSGLNNGTGVRGISNASSSVAPDGDGSGIGVHGKSASGYGVKGESTSAAGVYGVSVSQPGVDGTSTNSLGIRGTSTNFVGIVGISTNSHGLYGSSASPGNYGIIAENTTPGGGPGLYVTGSAFINGSLQVTGAKNAVIKMQDGSDAVVYCQEAPEPYFEDFGRAQLAAGVATVQLEREFAALVAGADYMVFITEEGPSGHLYVSRRNATGFEVRESDKGTSSISFTYRVVTKRKDIEGKRFARVPNDAKNIVAAARAKIANMPHGNGNSGTAP